jgi:hypothetical protein
MTRLALLTTLLALVLTTSASAAENFVGITLEGTLTTFNSQVPTQLRSPRKVPGVERGDRIVALAEGYALGRSGRVYRWNRAARSAAATPVRLSLTGKSFSIIPTVTGVRVLGDQGLDVTADLGSGVVTQGAGFRLAETDTPVTGVWAMRADGRMSGISPARDTLLTETAPGSGLVTEIKLDPQSSSPYARVRFATPVGYTIVNGTGWLITGLPELRNPQSALIRVNIDNADVRGESGPFFFRAFTAILYDGTVPDDTTAPRVSRVSTPKTVSLRDLRINNRVKVGLRCSEACIVQAGTAIGGRTNITMTASRDTPGTVRFGLFGLRGRAYKLMQARVGRTAIFRIRVQDWFHNETTVERTFRLTR